MPFEIDFATMLDYATKATNDTAQLSRKVCGNFKSGKTEVIERLILRIKQLPENHPIKELFGDGPVLVPAPRSAPPVSYTHLRAHETDSYLVCRLLLEKKK